MLFQATWALSCPTGFYDPGSGATRCLRCPIYFTECTDAYHGTVMKQFIGYTTNVAAYIGIPISYCQGGLVYNKEKDVCQVPCKSGCSACVVDIDFCTDCESGHLWNTDFTCIPAVIGLEAGSLGISAISLVFLIISCCYINKARKWNQSKWSFKTSISP